MSMSERKKKPITKATMSEECEEKQAGRPRCPHTHLAILEATRDLMTETGFTGLTIEGIAERAGVGKTTIYRHWPDKAKLVMEAFFTCANPKLAFPDTGSLREDLVRQMRALVREFNGPMGQTVATLIAGMQNDAALAEAFRQQWIEARRAESRAVIERSKARGELRAEIEPDALLDALHGPLYFRLLTKYAPLNAAFAERLIDLVLSGLLNPSIQNKQIKNTRQIKNTGQIKKIMAGGKK